MSYAAAKAGLIYFTRTLAVELGKHNINVNGVAPGRVYTGMAERSTERKMRSDPEAKGMTTREYWEKFVLPSRRAPLKRELKPEDIGHAVVFLASEEARNITGQTLGVDLGEFTI